MARDPLPDSDLAVLARHVRLDLSAERRAALGPAPDGMLTQFDALFDVDIGETPPTNAFDPRWRARS